MPKNVSRICSSRLEAALSIYRSSPTRRTVPASSRDTIREAADQLRALERRVEERRKALNEPPQDD